MACLQSLSMSIIVTIVVIFAEAVDSYCDSYVNFQIRFPFWLPGYAGSEPAVYPGFELSCNKHNQMIINLPSSGNFTVEYIDYVSQSIYIDDPRKCLPQRFLRHRFNLSGSPFRANQLRRYSFYNCSASRGGMSGSPHFREIQCLSGANYSVVAVPTLHYEIVNTAYCYEISQSFAPVGYQMDLGEGVKLNWDTPSCSSCVQRGGYCGFKGPTPTTTLDVKCYGIKNNSGSTKAKKYGITIGFGIPGVLCLIGLACYTCGCCDNRRSSRDSPTRVARPQPATVTTGLDGLVIESYPKFVLGQSRRLPEPDDGCCAICLSEYRPLETLRSIPECNHYFHAECVDGWLSINPTCPLCRNTPRGIFIQTRLWSPMALPSTTPP